MNNETPPSSAPQDARLAELLAISDVRAFTEAECAEIRELQRQARQKGPTMKQIFDFVEAHSDPSLGVPRC